jgi:predicted dithiol-disulfide oxidoreductase (DUF899 family)
METKSHNMNTQTIKLNRIVSQEEWLETRKQFLLKEKEITRLTDEVNEERRRLPWVKIDKPYVFDTPNGKQTLADLFDGRTQLIIKHFMFGPGWKEGCVGCSFGSDHIDGANLHLAHHDVSLAAVSRAPLEEIEAFKRRMGWNFKWVSSFNNDFNFDFHVSFNKADLEKGKVFYNYKMRYLQSEEMSGLSVFYKDEEENIYHTYSTFARGDEKTVGTYMYLDITPRGRNETGPNFDLTDWVRHHDRYDGSGIVNALGRYVAETEKKSDSCCH